MNVLLLAGAVALGMLVLIAGTRALQLRAEAPMWARVVLGAALAAQLVSVLR